MEEMASKKKKRTRWNEGKMAFIQSKYGFGQKGEQSRLHTQPEKDRALETAAVWCVGKPA